MKNKDVRTLKDKIIDIELKNSSVIFWNKLAQQRLRHMKEGLKDPDSDLNRDDMIKYLSITLDEIGNAIENANFIETEARTIYLDFKKEEKENEN